MDFNTGLFRRPTKSLSTHQLNSIHTEASQRLTRQHDRVTYFCGCRDRGVIQKILIYKYKKPRARSIQPKFPEISVQNSMDRFGQTGKVSIKRVHLLRWTNFPGRTGWNFGWMDRAPTLAYATINKISGILENIFSSMSTIWYEFVSFVQSGHLWIR